MRSKLRLKGIAFALVMLLTLCYMAPAAFALDASLSEKAKLYEEPDAKSKNLASIPKGASVTVLDCMESGEWWKIAYKGKEGYAESKSLTLRGEEGYAARNTQIRVGRGSQHRSLCAVPANAQIKVLDHVSDSAWWQIQYKEYIGYTQANSVKLGKPEETQTNTGSTGSTGSTGGTAGATGLSALDPNAEKIQKAKGINKDTVGWIKVPNTNIDDPMLYGADFYYNDHNIYKKKSLEGVYPYVNRMTRNVVIFGHNLRGSNSGFHQLHHLQEAALGRSSCQYGGCKRSISNLAGWQNSSSGRTWSVSIFGKSKWEVWAMYEVPRNESITTLRNNWNTSPGNMQSWIEGQLKRSQIDFGVSVSEKDQIMTIITCGTNYDSATANSRLFTFLKCVG